MAILGSAGRYGRWLSAFFDANPSLATEVRGHDPADPTTVAPAELADWADVVVFCAPVATTNDVIERFARYSPEGAPRQLWMDLTSIKAAPVAAMLAAGAEVLGLHPMCAPPPMPHLLGQRMVVCEGRLARWRPWSERFLAATQATLVPLAAEEHDRRAALVQGLGHAAHLAQLTVLARSGVARSSLDACATPTFGLDMAMGMRVLAGDPRLYAGLLGLTPDSSAALVALRDACETLLQAAEGPAPLDALAGQIEALQAWAGTARIDEGDAAYRRAIDALRSRVG